MIIWKTRPVIMIYISVLKFESGSIKKTGQIERALSFPTALSTGILLYNPALVTFFWFRSPVSLLDFGSTSWIQFPIISKIEFRDIYLIPVSVKFEIQQWLAWQFVKRMDTDSVMKGDIILLFLLWRWFNYLWVQD